MRARSPVVLVVLVATLFVAPAAAQPGLSYHKDLPAALKEAKTLGVPALVALAKPKATPPTFTDARTVEKSRGFACASVALTPALAKQYDLDGEFHILLLNSDGTVAEKFGADVTPEQLWFKMTALAGKTRDGFLETLRSDADAKAKKAALAGLARVGPAAPDLLPLLAGSPGDTRDAARKLFNALPADATAAALLDGLKSDDPAVRAACHPLAITATGYKGAPLKVWQSGTAEERAAAWGKWNDAAQGQTYSLNRAVLAFCEKNMDVQVNNGECAMLLVDAYKEAKAKPMFHSGKTYVWGRELRPGEPVVPGDVVQFEGTKFADGWTYPHHTSVIRKVLAPGKLETLEQNVGGIKKVRPGKLDLTGLKEGSVVIYRPQR